MLEIWTSDGHLELFGQRPVVGQNQSSEAKVCQFWEVAMTRMYNCTQHNFDVRTSNKLLRCELWDNTVDGETLKGDILV